MAEIPHFTLGSYGKLTAEAMNAIIEQAYSVTPTEQNQTPLPVFGPGNFPIYVQLGGVVTEADKEPPKGDDRDDGDGKGKGGGDGEGEEGEGEEFVPRVGGYTWHEVSWDVEERKWSTSQAGRTYSPSTRNAAYAIGVDYIDEGQAPSYEGSHVMLFPSSDKKGIPILVFEPPAPNPKTFPAVITNSPGSDCEIKQADWYGFTRTRLILSAEGLPLMTEITGDDVTGIAFNLIELTGGNLGGSISGAQCGVVWDYTKVPEGTHVLVTRVGQRTNGEAVYGFVVPNDTCVNCCTDGLLASAGRTQHAFQSGSDIDALMMQG